jgi:hypothetical protein
MSAVRAQLPFHLHSDHPYKKDVDEAVAEIAAEAALCSVVYNDAERAAEAQTFAGVRRFPGSWRR